MPVKHCCYGDCNSDSRYVGKRIEMENVFFIPFPKPKTKREKCEKWIRLCGRKFFEINNVTKDTYICSKHFVGGHGPTESYPDPLPAMATNFEVRRISSKTKRKSPTNRSTPIKKSRKRLVYEDMNKDGVVEYDTDITENTSTYMASDLDHNYCRTDGSSASTMSFQNMQSVDSHEPSDDQIAVSEVILESGEIEEIEIKPKTKECEVQTEITLSDMEHYFIPGFKDERRMKRNLFLNSVLKDDGSCKFYTGLTLSLLTLVFTWVQTKAAQLNYWRGQDTSDTNEKCRGRKRQLTVKEEFILTLVRLRRGFEVEIISDLFGIHSSSVSRIFTTWINFLHLELKFLISWPSKDQVKANLPKQFRYFPKTRVIIDCTEFFVQKPSLPSSQRITWSQYKHNNTFKALIGVTPTGTFSFISNVYTGSISDKRIVESCGFLDKLEYGDDVMADRGFLIRDLLAQRYATLNIPPFSFGRQLSSKAVTKTRRIASVRIHVERAIGRLKNFKILQGIMPLKLNPVFDQMIVVCASLCNLDVKLVK